MNSKIIKIANKKIGGKNPAFIIAEIGQAHEGSLGIAHAYIEAIAKTGADAVKFQTHIAEAESSKSEPWRIKFSYQDKTRFDYWKRMEFTKEQWLGLKKHAEDKKLIFLSSPFSLEAIELLESIGILAWKIPSGEVNNKLILDHIIRTKLPIILSTGMSNLEEIDSIIQIFKGKNIDFALLQCTSSYPCPPEKIGINLIPFFQKRYSCPIGISDHTGKIYSTFAAVTIGASIIEVHTVLSRECFGPDVSSSLTISELKTIVEGSRFINKINLNPVDKDLSYLETLYMKKLFNKSIFYKKSLSEGEILKKEYLSFLKPGIGIPPEKVNNIIGKILARNVSEGDLLKIDDLEV